MVRHSHLIAGPAYRLEFVLRQMAQDKGDLSKKVYLRKKDYLKHVAASLNELIKRVPTNRLTCALSSRNERVGFRRAELLGTLAGSEGTLPVHVRRSRACQRTGRSPPLLRSRRGRQWQGWNFSTAR